MDYAFTLYSTLLIVGCFVRLIFAANVCSMCPGERTKNISNCNHKVRKQIVEQQMNSSLSDIVDLIKNEEKKLNKINTSELSEQHLTYRLRKRKKIHKKIIFIHESYEIFTVIYKVLEKVGEVFDINGSKLLENVKNLMCLMHQENDRFHCPKKALTFSATTSCKRNKTKSYIRKRSMSDDNCFKSKCIELEALSDTRKIREMLRKTLCFWKECVGDKRGHLSLRRKCRPRRKKNARKGKRRPSKKTSKSRRGRRKPRHSFLIMHKDFCQ